MSELLQYLTGTRATFQDPRRLNSLYGDFAAHEQSNPEGYRANVDEWRRALIAAAREGVIPAAPGSKEADGSRFVIQTGDHLLSALETKQYGIPVALGTVVEDAVKSKSFMEVKDYRNAEQSIYQKSWLPSIPSLSDFLIWTWRHIGYSGSSQHTLPNGRWVIPENLEAASAMFLKHMDSLSASSAVSNVHTLRSIQQSLPVPLSENDMSLLLTYLARDKPRLSYRSASDGSTIIKLGTSPVNETDITIATLKNLHTNISSQISPLETSIAQLDQQARAAVASKNTTTARAALKRKKLVSDALDRRQDQAFSIQQTLDKIDQAADNVALVRAMNASAGVLQRLNAEIGGVEGAERVSDALAEQMGTVDEVTSVLNEPGVGQVVDEAEVDDEFEALMKQEDEKRESERKQREDADTLAKMKELEEWEREKGANVEQPVTEKDNEVEQATKEVAQLSL